MLKIEFEGTDGAGKTTGLKYVVDRLRNAGTLLIETREVGAPQIPVNVKLRELVLDPASNLSGEAMELIFAAMRVENDIYLKHTAQFTDVECVLSDRGWLSHLAYGDNNTSAQFTRALFLNCISEYAALPNIIVYFDISSDTGLQRRTKRGTTDVIEAKGAAFQDAVRASFEAHMSYLPDYVKVFKIDANGDIPSVQAQLDKVVSYILTVKSS